MTEAQEILDKLTEEQKAGIKSWPYKSWVLASAVPTVLMQTGLFDQQRFPMSASGRTKRSLNHKGLAVRALLEKRT